MIGLQHSLIVFISPVVLLFFHDRKHDNNIHPTYVSVAEINYDNKYNYADLVCKTFTDDLELALQKKFGVKENLLSPADFKKASSEVEAYIQQHLQIKINGSIVNYSFQNYQQQENAIVSHFRIDNLKNISQFEIMDTIFYELYDSQIQIIYVTVNGNKKFSSIRNPVTKLSFAF